MKESTRVAIERATQTLAKAGVALTEAGFKYHSERIWLGVTKDDSVVWLTIGADGKSDMWLYRVDEDRDALLEAAEDADGGGTAVKKKGGKKKNVG